MLTTWWPTPFRGIAFCTFLQCDSFHTAWVNPGNAHSEQIGSALRQQAAVFLRRSGRQVRANSRHGDPAAQSRIWAIMAPQPVASADGLVAFFLGCSPRNEQPNGSFYVPAKAKRMRQTSIISPGIHRPLAALVLSCLAGGGEGAAFTVRTREVRGCVRALRRIPVASVSTVTCASPEKPSARAPAGVRSMMRPRTNGPRSLIVTTIERPFF
jgi:hypothetical protein